MLDKLFKPVLHFFGILGSSLAGIGAILMAIGFLAEKSRLVMLGFTQVPVDLNLYLFIGAKFVAYLPILLFSALGLNMVEHFLLTFLILFFIILIFFFIHFSKRGTRFLQQFKVGVTNFATRVIRGLFISLVFLQLIWIFQLLKSNEIDNLLYIDQREIAKVSEYALFPSKEILTAWVTNRIDPNNSKPEKTNVDYAFMYFGWLLLVALLLGGVLLGLIRLGSKGKGGLSFWKKFWMGLNLVLFFTQVILIPINFGILVLPNTYPACEISLQNHDNNDPQLAKQLYLLHMDDEELYFYSPDSSKVWSIKRDIVRSIEYLGMKDLFDKKN